MDSKVIEYSGNGIEARVVVSAANVLQGMKRTRLKPNKDDLKGLDEDALIIRVFEYPDMVAAARELNINGVTTEPTFKQFCELPEAFAKEWEQATYELNPHWMPTEGDDEKKG